MSDYVPIKRALLSVSNKTDLVPFARKLASLGVILISTGGTKRVLEEAGLTVIAIDEVTDFPEMMDGRVKTLHPKVHGGLLALRDKPDHVKAMNDHHIAPIDLVCINLYPFEQTVAHEDVTEAEAIEQIDIGGPSMVRSAAKNHRFVTVVTDPSQYDMVVNELDAHGGSTSLDLRRRLCCAAFARTAAYDTAISEWLCGAGPKQFPAALLMRLDRSPTELRYGENPHQAAALYTDPKSKVATVAKARQLHGIPLGYCNIFDADGALDLVKEIDPDLHAAAAVIKHANPCGFAIADDLPTAFDKAYDGDPQAAFGGIVALNRNVDLATAQAIAAGKKFLHVIVAPSYDGDAAKLLSERWKDVRILAVGPLGKPDDRPADELVLRRIAGGLLVQEPDLAPMDAAQWEHKAGPEPTAEDLTQLALAMIAVKHLKSNAVCIVRDHMLVGPGMGQVDRVSACELAIKRAGDRAKGGYAASDAFFPFGDSAAGLIAAGVKAIVEPGGAKKDDETIAACREANVTLLFTGRRHFRH
jgi:phosphoribosylaminoimidazolecarboxamide formyltransferase/IMP cyclohydrolase